MLSKNYKKNSTAIMNKNKILTLPKQIRESSTLNYIDENSFQMDSEVNLTNPNPTMNKLDYSLAIRASFFPNPLPSPAVFNKSKSKLFDKNRKSAIPSHFSDKDIPLQNDEETEEETFACIRHNNMKILLHCADCNMPLCLHCMKTHHQDKKKHEYIEINELKEKISCEADVQMRKLEENVENLEPEFNLDEIQQVGLKTIYESKERLIKIIDDYYEELIKNYNSLTYKKPISLQKTAILDKQKELIESLQKFKKPDFHINLIAEYFRSQYNEEIKSLEENILSFQMKIRKEFRRLPSIKNNLDVLKNIEDLLLNYISISFGTQKPEIPKKISILSPKANIDAPLLKSTSLTQ